MPLDNANLRELSAILPARLPEAEPLTLSLPDIGLDTEQTSTSSFQQLLTQAGQALLKPQQIAEQAIQSFSQGLEGDLHQVILSQEKADITLKFFVSVRNRCLEAYREIMHLE